MPKIRGSHNQAPNAAHTFALSLMEQVSREDDSQTQILKERPNVLPNCIFQFKQEFMLRPPLPFLTQKP